MDSSIRLCQGQNLAVQLTDGGRSDGTRQGRSRVYIGEVCVG